MTYPEALKASAAMLTPSAWRSCSQDEKEDRPFAMPDAAERKVLELANAVEADHAGRRHQHAISEAGGEEYGAAVKAAIAHGWLTMHPSGAYVSFTQAGAELFA